MVPARGGGPRPRIPRPAPEPGRPEGDEREGRRGDTPAEEQNAGHHGGEAGPTALSDTRGALDVARVRADAGKPAGGRRAGVDGGDAGQGRDLAVLGPDP